MSRFSPLEPSATRLLSPGPRPELARANEQGGGRLGSVGWLRHFEPSRSRSLFVGFSRDLLIARHASIVADRPPERAGRVRACPRGARRGQAGASQGAAPAGLIGAGRVVHGAAHGECVESERTSCADLAQPSTTSTAVRSTKPFCCPLTCAVDQMSFFSLHDLNRDGILDRKVRSLITSAPAHSLRRSSKRSTACTTRRRARGPTRMSTTRSRRTTSFARSSPCSTRMATAS